MTALSSADRSRRFRRRHPERAREYDRARDRARRHEANPQQKRAWNITAAAIRRGKLKRQPCEVCGLKNAQAHHDDYFSPLDVRWLCRDHHEQHHARLRKERRALDGSEATTVGETAGGGLGNDEPGAAASLPSSAGEQLRLVA